MSALSIIVKQNSSSHWIVIQGFLGGSAVRNSPENAGDRGLIPGSGRSPREGNGNPIQFSCLGNLMDRRAWQAIEHGVAKRDSVQFSSAVQSCPTLCNSMDHSMPGLPVHHQLLTLTQTHIYCVSDAIQPSHPLLFPSPPASIFPSIRVFSNESVLHIRWPEYCSFSFNISLSNEYSGLISFRTDWLDLLAAQGTLKSLLQHHSSESINSFALSFLYSPTLTFIHDSWKKRSIDQMDLCQQSNVSAFQYAVQVGHSFSSKEEASFNFMATITICSDFGAPKNKISQCFDGYPSICHEVIEPDAMILVF